MTDLPAPALPRVQLIVGSTRPGRIGRRVADWVSGIAVDRHDFVLEVLDLAEIGLPLFDEPHHPRLRRYEHEHTRRWSASVERGDAFIFVMPEYNWGINAALKNAVDYLFHEWRHKPVGFVSYGGASGGLRAAQMMRQVVGALSMPPMTSSVAIPFVTSHLPEDGGFSADEHLDASVRALFDELVAYATAMRSLRS